MFPSVRPSVTASSTIHANIIQFCFNLGRVSSNSIPPMVSIEAFRVLLGPPPLLIFPTGLLLLFNGFLSNAPSQRSQNAALTLLPVLIVCTFSVIHFSHTYTHIMNQISFLFLLKFYSVMFLPPSEYTRKRSVPAYHGQ